MTTTHHAVGIPVEAIGDLDRLVGEALQAGRRPLGRRPCRGAILAELVHAAAHPAPTVQQPVQAPTPRVAKTTAPAKIDPRVGLSTRRGGGR